MLLRPQVADEEGPASSLVQPPGHVDRPHERVDEAVAGTDFLRRENLCLSQPFQGVVQCGVYYFRDRFQRLSQQEIVRPSRRHDGKLNVKGRPTKRPELPLPGSRVAAPSLEDRPRLQPVRTGECLSAGERMEGGVPHQPDAVADEV